MQSKNYGQSELAYRRVPKEIKVANCKERSSNMILASENLEKSYTGRTRIKQKEVKEKKENKEDRRIKEEIIDTYKNLTPKDRGSKAGTPARFPKPVQKLPVSLISKIQSTPVLEEQDDCSPPSGASSTQRVNKSRGRVPTSNPASSIASTKEKAEARKEEREDQKAQRREQTTVSTQVSSKI